MRILAWILIVGGVMFSLSNIRDHIRGHTSLSDPYIHHATMSMDHAVSEKEGEVFRGAMAQQWIYAGSLLTIGIVMLSVISSQDKTDIFSVDLDSLGDLICLTMRVTQPLQARICEFYFMKINHQPISRIAAAV